MNGRIIFRSLVVGEILFAVSAGFVDGFWPALIPDPIRQGLASYEEAAQMSSLLIAIIVPMVGLALVSSIGLFFFWRPARVLYVTGFVLSIPGTLLLGPNVTSAIGSTLIMLAETASGMILIAMFVPPFDHHFQRGAQHSVPTKLHSNGDSPGG